MFNNKRYLKRSPNYTNEEREYLLSLVEKYKGIVESKQTGAYFIQKKKEAWMAITREYNSICTTGPRNDAMLKHFYTNIKYRSRKVSATEKKEKCLYEPPVNTENIDENASLDENQFKGQNKNKKFSDGMNSVNRNSSGTFNPLLMKTNHPIMNIKIEPDVNPYDEAAEYFGDTDPDVTTETINASLNGSRCKDTKTDLSDEKNNVNRTSGGTFNSKYGHHVDIKIEPYEKSYDEVTEYFGEVDDEVTAESNNVRIPENRRMKPLHSVKRKVHLNAYRNMPSELLKKIYYKKKIELVLCQKKNEMQKFRQEKIKYNLEIKLLKMQLEKAEGNIYK